MDRAFPYRSPDGLIRGLMAAIIPSILAWAMIIALLTRLF